LKNNLSSNFYSTYKKELKSLIISLLDKEKSILMNSRK